MTTYTLPVSHRGTVTRWHVNSPHSRMTARITRSIDTDGDETWRVDVHRNGTWVPAPSYSGRNKEAADRIRAEFDVVLYEMEMFPPGPGELSRQALHVGGRHDDDFSPGMIGPGYHWDDVERDR